MLQTSINERFKEIAEKLYNGNIKAMAEQTDISRTTLQDILGGKKSNPGYKIIRHIAEISTPKISLEWLILGVGSMFATEENNAPIVQNNTNSNIGSQINDSNVLNRLLSHIEKLEKQIEQKDKEINRLVTLLEKK